MLILIIIGLIYFVSSIKYIGILMLRPESTRLNSLRTSAEMSTLIRPPPGSVTNHRFKRSILIGMKGQISLEIGKTCAMY